MSKELKVLTSQIVLFHTPPKGSTSVTIEAVLVVYHLLLQWDCVPADLWYSNGVTGVSGCS